MGRDTWGVTDHSDPRVAASKSQYAAPLQQAGGRLAHGAWRTILGWALGCLGMSMLRTEGKRRQLGVPSSKVEVTVFTPEPGGGVRKS